MISLVTGLNSIQYVGVDNLLPNPENTLSKDIAFQGVVNGKKCQKFMTSETITTQVQTNYIVTGGDTLTAILIDSLGGQAALTVDLAASFTDTLTGEITAFYEFGVVGQAIGRYQIEIKGTADGESKYRRSETFEIVEGVKGFRHTLDDKFEYEYIPNHIKMVASNTENQAYNYWADGFEVSIWVEGVNGKPQSGGEVDTYDNLGNLTTLETIDQHTYEFKTVDIPQYLLLKIQSLLKLDFATLNDKQYVLSDNGEAEYFGNYTDGVLTLNLTQAFVEGINSDDQGVTIIENNDMAAVEIKKITNVSGAHQLTISGGYTLNQITLALESGTQADIKIGSTPSGNEIMRSETIAAANPVLNLARNYVNQSDEAASFVAYVEISGVGASATVILQTIINKQ